LLDIAPGRTIAASRFPPIPYVDPPPRRIPEVERKILRLALASAPELPTDWPELTPLIEAIEQTEGTSV